MRISEIDIDRFRIWRSLLLRLEPRGLNVIYGPNEAGKSTVMQFVRSILYGFDPLCDEPAWDHGESEQPWSGALCCEHKGQSWRISRKSAIATRGRCQVAGVPTESGCDDAVAMLLSNIRESVFNDVFSLGVRELQQLSTLENEQVAEYLYGMSLGRRGRQLLNAIRDVDLRQAALLTAEGTQGRLAELFGNYTRLSADSIGEGESREEHARLTRQRGELLNKISQWQARQSEIESELKGLRFLSICFQPWKRIRELNDALSKLPVIRHSPEEGLRHLDDCDRDIQRYSADHEKLSDQADSLRAQVKRIEIDLRFEKSRYAIQSLVNQTDWLRQIDQQITEAEDRSMDLKHDLDRQLGQLGDNWDVGRLQAVDTSPSAHQRLLTAARRYQDAAQRRSKLRRWSRSLARRSQQELIELSNDMNGMQAEAIPEALEQEQTRLTELENLGRLRLQREQLALKIQTVRKILNRVDTDDTIPPWVDRAVVVITTVALILFFFGMVTLGLGVSGPSTVGGSVAAGAFAFAGMMLWGIRNGMRNYFDRKTGIRLDDLNDEARQAEVELSKLHAKIQGMQLPGGVGLHSGKKAPGTSSTAYLVECIGECSRHITELERLTHRHEQTGRRRRRLTALRTRFRSAQQGLNDRRQEWCRTLKALGMDETVKVQEAFDCWQMIQEVRELHARWCNSSPEVEGLRRMFDGMGARVRHLSAQVAPTDKPAFHRPLEILSAWEQQLKTHDRDRAERERLNTEAGEKSQDAVLAKHQLEAAELRRGAVLARNGVLSRGELTQQQERVRKRNEAESQLEFATEELNEVVSEHPELAIVEDDLSGFNPQDARQSVQILELELEDVERELISSHETVGSLKEQIQRLESSRDSQQHHFKRSQLAWDIHRTAEEWYALQYEKNAVWQMRKRFEKDNISSTLRMASSYLHRMTSGRYQRLWVPLGEDFLCIDDKYNRTFRAEQLSGGTREQLFLAVRFALVRQFSEQDVELPMVMDDLFVNFDEERTAVAMDCLMELADSGQQILFFTCHRHLAEQFRKRDVETLWLPGHRVSQDLNQPEDRPASDLGDDKHKKTARIDAPELPLTQHMHRRVERESDESHRSEH